MRGWCMKHLLDKFGMHLQLSKTSITLTQVAKHEKNDKYNLWYVHKEVVKNWNVPLNNESVDNVGQGDNVCV